MPHVAAAVAEEEVFLLYKCYLRGNLEDGFVHDSAITALKRLNQ